ncbi:serine/threonine protein kinase [Halobacillus fulvus]|nr:serine/threonine protein kinase [Halobacillus fulvus]
MRATQEALWKQVEFKGDKVVSYPSELEWVGQGRSAVVFRIPQSDRVVKIFYPQFHALARIEADVYRKLANHDLFPELFEAGDGYLVMEYIEGVTLYDCLVQGIPITEEMIHGVDEALDFARRKGLNPSDTHLKNIILTSDQNIKVIDVVRFTQEEECPHWEDLKKAYFKYYQRSYFPKKYPKFFVELIIRLYRRRWLPI